MQTQGALHHMAKVLFILKRREDYNSILHSHIGLSTGLFNSASFVNDMLTEQGIESKLSVVTDNNCIDREVTAYRPTHVIIEALWVVPSKFEVLQRLHPNVTWIIRLHSEAPFIANEGMSMDWLGHYSKFENIVIGVNAPRMMREVKMYLKSKNSWTEEETDKRVIYLPNYYPQEYKTKKFDRTKDTLDICCFGAVRPLKNHLLQALAAIDFANQMKKPLRFHINAGRIEMKGEPVLNNLRELFAHLEDQGHQIISHQWTPREQFLELCSAMDIGMQVSFSETFNIVGADLISQGVPIVGSREIPWSVDSFNADPVDSQDITAKLKKTYNWAWMNVKTNQMALTNYTSKTTKIWKKYFA
jgi:hypothetical protein